MRLVKTLAPLAFLGVVACGIDKDVHQKTLDDLAQANGNLDKCNTRTAALESENKKLGGKLTEASSMASDLQQNLTKTSGDLAASKVELEDLRKQRALAEARMKTFKDLAQRLKSMVDSGKLQVQIRKGKMIVKLADNVLFAAGNATLKKEGQGPLADVATALKEIKGRDFLVTGHTDNTPMHSARFASNWELSTQRAVDVVKFLASQGVDEAHLAAAGYADTDPVVDNDTPEHKQQNRRIEIVVMPAIEDLPKLDDQG